MVVERQGRGTDLWTSRELALNSPKALVLLFGAVMLLAGQSGHTTPFTGTWKLDLAKSSFNPGPAFKDFTITFTPDGVRHLK